MCTPLPSSPTSSSHTMPHTQLPPDVWHHIALFLSPQAISSLWTLNSVFFNLAMDIKYQQISFSYLSKRMLRVLRRLKECNEVRRRVRVLYLYPGFLREALEQEKERDAKEKEKEKDSSLLGKLGEIAGQIRERCHHPKSSSNPAKIKTAQDLVQMMIQTLSLLPNLQEYHIAWSGLPTLPNSVPVPLLRAPFKSGLLKRIYFDISLDKLEALFPLERDDLHGVEEMQLFLRAPSCNASHTRPRLHFPPLPNLTHLTIQAFDTLPSSPSLDIFTALNTLPRLHTLSLNIPISSYPFLGSPRSVRDFVYRHRGTLRMISLRGNDLGSLPVSGSTGGESGSLDTWLREALLPPPSLNLDIEHLEINLSLLPLSPILTFLQSLSSSSSNLTALKLTTNASGGGSGGRFLSSEELECLLDTLSPSSASTSSTSSCSPSPLTCTFPSSSTFLSTSLPASPISTTIELESLTLPLQTLSPTTFDILSSSPALRYLKKLEVKVRDGVVCGEGEVVLNLNLNLNFGLGLSSWIAAVVPEGKEETEEGDEEKGEERVTVLEALSPSPSPSSEGEVRGEKEKVTEVYHCRRYPARYGTPGQDEEQIDRFLDTMLTRARCSSYAHWGLERLKLVLLSSSSAVNSQVELGLGTGMRRRKVFEFDFTLPPPTPSRTRGGTQLEMDPEGKWREVFEECFMPSPL
ncbi:hypothetical protein VKT23_017109 [Stygiomarasmius scandens]|uniref:F-box domain-containing protein n=1 Tax=Marasmiellus scandens TaxID=2682957 RepID=A0ABR1IWL2_9AGAR